MMKNTTDERDQSWKRWALLWPDGKIQNLCYKRSAAIQLRKMLTYDGSDEIRKLIKVIPVTATRGHR